MFSAVGATRVVVGSDSTGGASNGGEWRINVIERVEGVVTWMLGDPARVTRMKDNVTN